MKKVTVILAVLLALGLCRGTLPAQAQEPGLFSRGGIVYQEDGAGAELYAEDFLFLQDKLSTASGGIFDPVCYTHTHVWEYRDVGDRTHTRHCALCGDAFDLVSAHVAGREEDCAITCGGGEYPGRRYTCACGYQWVREAAHVLTFDQVDEVSHKSRCILEDTGYCRGYEFVSEEHYAYFYEPCQDGVNHEKVCIDCGYRTKEPCEFALISSETGDGGQEEAVRCCHCGKEKKTEQGGEEPGESETPEEPGGAEAPEEPGGAETPEAPGESEGPGEPETPEEPGESETPEEPGGAETPEAPGESDMPGLSVSGNGI